MLGLPPRPAPNPFPFGPATVAELIDAHVRDRPEQLALLDNERTWTYAELDAAVCVAAGALRQAGVRAGDRVAWTLPNCAELPIGFLACMRIGAIWLGVNQALAEPERRYLLDDSAASIHVDDLATFCATLETSVPFDRVPIDPHAPAAIAYTSGTTGRPKGAVHSQHNLLWPGLASVEMHPPKDGERQGTALAHTILNMMLLGPISAFVRGSTAVMLERTDAVGFSDAISKYAITRTTVVPTMVHDLAENDDVDRRSLASLEHIVIGGAGTPAAVRTAFLEKFGLRPILGYGLSEAPTGVGRESPDDPISDEGGCFPMPPFDFSILGDDGAHLAPGTPGEICVAATSTGRWAGSWSPMLGYLGQPDATATTLRDGVLHTGDIGTLDADGRLRIVARKTDVILRGGANVYPAEVERVLLTHPDVRDAAVFGIEDRRLGERVVALVEGSASVEELSALCTTNLARYKVPSEIRLCDAIARTQMGKIERASLRQRWDNTSPPDVSG